MTASLQELQEHAQVILVLLGVRLQSGQLVLNITQGRVASIETKTYQRLPQHPTNGRGLDDLTDSA